MAAEGNLRRKLAMAVKSIQWNYAIFWSIPSTQPGVLTWCDGYYNGDIKTRKTIQATEEMEDDDDNDNDNDDELGLQRTEQLRQLYESLSAASETYHYELQQTRPPTALAPEDLTDTEWYFLVCMTFEFTNSQGLPGRTLAQNTTIWLTDAHLAESKVFNRSILAKSASIQTVVCFPYLDGVAEFGTTQKVLEEQNFIKQIKAIISNVPPRNVIETPLDSCSSMLDHQDLVYNNLDKLLECDQNQSQEQSWQFVDCDNEGEISFHRNNSAVGSNDCVSQNVADGPGDVWSSDDDRYQRVLKIFNNTSQRLISRPRFGNHDVKESAFVSWNCYDGIESNGKSSQMLLKSLLYKVPKMHDNHRIGKLEAVNVNSIDHRFSVLSSLVPSREKVDKVSLLDDTIDYLKTLERKVEQLQSYKNSCDVRERTCDNYCNKRKASCDLKDLHEECFSNCITVSAIEKDVTIEIQCRWRDNMMVQVFDALSSLNLESQSVHSSTVDGILTLTIESKLKSCTVKMISQALQRVIGSRY